MTEFTPMLSVSGGLLIGLSALAVFISLDVFWDIGNCCSHAKF